MIIDPLLHIDNFTQVFQHWAERAPERLVFRFLENGEGDGLTLTYGELDVAARRIGAAMLAEARPGDRVLLLYSPGLEFVEAFAACLYAGLVAVPVYPPAPRQLDRTLPRLQAIAAVADVQLVATTAMIHMLLKPMMGDTPELGARPWLATDSVTEGAPASPAFDASPDALTLLQFTSGSTGTPRGVMVTHRNLLHNERGIRHAFGHDVRDAAGVGWLPTYHDMGLIGKVLQTIYLGTSTVLLSPLDFLQQPVRWLKAISRWRGGTCGGPNFAYELCTRRVRDEDLASLDLSSWNVAFCGAEPVSHETLRQFARRFAPCGFRSESFFPCYGLAEGTLMVSGGWLGSTSTTRWVRSEALERGVAAPAAPQTLGASALVSCGEVLEGQRVAIVEPETGVEVASERVGEVWVAGPSVAAGYWRDPSGTEETFTARLANGDGPWLRTGDLGFLSGGQLYVTGRCKDMLIVHGRNLYPQDIEATVHAAHPGVYAGSTAAVTLSAEGEERLGLVVGLRREHDAATVELAVRQAVAAEHGLSIFRLAVVDPREVPRTSSGKIQRAECRDRLMGGLFKGTGASPATQGQPSFYADPQVFLEKLDNRNTRYRFDIEADVLWDRADEPGQYFPPSVLGRGGIDTASMAAIPGMAELFQWSLAVAICEEFVALGQRIIVFLREELAAGRLPATRSADLFDEEEVKHVSLFRRYADHLKAQRPDVAASLDRHLAASFEGAWWFADRAEDYPSPAIYHFVAWLHFVYFEEYYIYLCRELQENEGMQPAWVSAHIAHMQEERQHVLTDAAHLSGLDLTEAARRQWSTWFLEQSARDASGLAGLEGVWTFLVEQLPGLDKLPQPSSLLSNVDLRKRAFLRLINHERSFTLTLRHATGMDDFVQAVAPAAATAVDQPASAPEAPAVAPASTGAERAVRELLVEAIAGALRMSPELIDVTQPLIYFGLDSVHAVKISGDLELLLGRKLPPTLLFDHPTIEALAAALSTSGPAEPAPTVRHRADDLMLDPLMFGEASPQEPARHVLVTGATGFLCGFLLAELLRTTPHTVSCLVRASSAAEGLERLRANLTGYGLWEAPFADRIEVVTGDLELPLLGLSATDFEALARRVEVIYHGGAIVDFIQPYERLRAANVNGTHEVVRLALQGGRVPLNLISTIGIFDTCNQTGLRAVGEQDVPDEAAGFRNGYGESKWIAERLVRQAGQRGLPIRVFRPGVVGGSTTTGAWQPDLMATLLTTYARQGAAIQPVADGMLDAAPVDYVARAILHISNSPNSVGGVFHLTNPRPTPWGDVYEALGRIGHPVEPVPYATWLKNLESDQAFEDLRPFLAYFKTRSEAWQLRQARMDCSSTLAALEGSGIACPVVDDRLLATYMGYLLSSHDRSTKEVADA